MHVSLSILILCFYTSKQLASEDCLFAFIYIQFARNVEKPRKGEL